MVYAANLLLAVVALGSASTTFAVPTGMMLNSRSPAKITVNKASGDTSQWSGSAAQANRQIQSQKADAQRKLKDAQSREAQMKAQAMNSYSKTEKSNAQALRLSLREVYEDIDARELESYIIEERATMKAGQGNGRTAAALAEAKAKEDRARQQLKDAKQQQQSIKQGTTGSFAKSDAAASKVFGRDIEEEDNEIFARATFKAGQGTGKSAEALAAVKAKEDQARQQLKNAQQQQQSIKQGTKSSYGKSDAAARKAFGRAI